MGYDLPEIEPTEISQNAFEKIGLSSWNSVVVPVVVIGETTMQGVGTAFNISPAGVWVTARHVLDEALKIASRMPTSHVAILWVGSGADEDVPQALGGPIPINYYCCDYRTDLAILRTNLLRDGVPFTFPSLTVGSCMRKEGAPILALGYSKFDVANDVTTEGSWRNIVIESEFNATTGEVTENYPEGRDETFLPTACFATSARFDHGMSGGPVMDARNVVVGIISTGYEADGGAGYVSFASATPHIFCLELREDEESTSIYEMVQSGLVRSDQYFKHVSLNRNGTQLQVTFPIQR